MSASRVLKKENSDGSEAVLKRTLEDAAKRGQPARHGASWEKEEIETLIEEIQSGLPLSELADRHQRTRAGITGVIMRLIPPPLRPKSRSRAIDVMAQHLREHDDADKQRIITEYCRARKIRGALNASEPSRDAPIQSPASMHLSEESELASREAYRTDEINVAMLVTVAISALPEGRDTDVLRMRHGMNDHPFTLDEIGKKFSISGERARQVEERSLRKLARLSRNKETPGATLKKMLEPLRDNEQALAVWLLDVARIGFESPPRIAAKFILRTAGYTKATSSKVLLCLSVIERSQRAKTSDYDSAQTTPETIKPDALQWLRYTDWPEEIESPPPATELATQRAIGKSDISGSFDSEKIGRPVAYESRLELEIMMELERSEHIAYYQEQPAKIPYTFEGRTRNYFPDLFAATTDGRGLLIEVKPTGNMALDINLAKAEAGRAWAHAHGWGWLILNNRCTFREIQEHVIPEEKWNLFNEELKRRGFLTWRDILRFRSQHDLTKLDFIAYIIQSGIKLDQTYRATVRDGIAISSALGSSA